MMKLSQIQQIPNPFLTNRFFDQPNFQNVLREVFSLKTSAFNFTLENTDGYINIQEDKTGIYSNFMGYGGPIMERQTGNISSVLSALQQEYGKKFRRIKLYPFNSQLPHNGFKPEQTWILDLTKFNLENLSKSVRYEVRKAKQNDVLIRPLEKEELESFYNIYKQTAARVGSSYLTPYLLFQKLHDIPACLFLGAFHKKELIATSVYLQSDQYVYFWWNSSTDKGRLLSANYSLTFEAINLFQNKGILHLDMASSHNEKILRSKENWGATPANFLNLSI